MEKGPSNQQFVNIITVCGDICIFATAIGEILDRIEFALKSFNVI